MKGWTSEAIAAKGLSNSREKSHQGPGNGPCRAHRYLIGIDCGVETGIALYDRFTKTLESVETKPIHFCMFWITNFWLNDLRSRDGLLVRVEDARLFAGRPPIADKKAEAGIREGAGSVKRDARIWEDFLTDYKIPFELVAPKNNATKLSSDSFKRITAYLGRTNDHGRDAAMLVYGF